MTGPENSEVRQALLEATQALKEGNQGKARFWADRATRLAPNLEDAWLILAAVSDPNDSLVYLKRALEINPSSRRARQGMHWAINRSRAMQSTMIEPDVKRSYEDTDRISLAPAQAVQAVTNPVATHQLIPKRKASRPAWATALPWAAVFSLLCLAFFAWMLFPTGWVVFAMNSSGPRPVGALIKPSLTPTASATYTPTPTSTYTPTSTFTATFTPKPTKKPKPTNTPAPVNPFVNENPPPPISAIGLGRWIDVNLSAQRVYIYDNEKLLKTFVVSTGTWNHPTVTGQFHVYVKYRYADMRGPGYYLPDVPYVMYFYQAYGLHGTYWHHNFGTPMSHGCINLKTEDAAWLFNWASIGTLVNIHN
jgi:lipoprotein-anchoring transpeptidase ErfK/SrfK